MCVWAPHSNSEADVSLHFLVHTCIDVIEEKGILLKEVITHDTVYAVVSQVSSKAGDPREHYLGLLYPSEDFKMYSVIVSRDAVNIVIF